jgi:lauroyl/myristoyl acyltransferase
MTAERPATQPPEPSQGKQPQETMGETLTYGLYRTAEWAATTLPEKAGRRLFTAMGLAHHAADPGSRRTVARNLSRVLGKSPDSLEVRAAVREAFQSYARYWFDTFLMRVIRSEDFLKRFEMRGLEHITVALEEGRGALLCLPHMGNWDAAAKWMTLNGYRINAVAEQLKPERLFKLWLEHRRALGLGIVPLSDKATVGRRLVELIEQNELVALVSDRDLRETGPVVEMFGAERRIPAGPALLSLSTGSPVIPAAVYDTEDGWLKTGDVGEWVDGTHVRITDRMKDIIITAGGKNISPSEIENALKASPYVKEAVVVGDGRKYLTALIGIELDTVGDWAQRRKIPYTTYRDLSEKPEVHTLIRGVVDTVNTRFAQAEQIKKFRMLPKELDHEDGELTATQKVKRSALAGMFGELIDAMYRE